MEETKSGGGSEEESGENTGREFEVLEAKARYRVEKALLHLRRALVRRGYLVSAPEGAPVFTGAAGALSADYAASGAAAPAFTAYLPKDAPDTCPARINGIAYGEKVWVVAHLSKACNTDLARKMSAAAKAEGVDRIILLTHKAINKRVLLLLEKAQEGVVGEAFTVREVAPDIAQHCLVPRHTPLIATHPEAIKHKGHTTNLSTEDLQIRLLGLGPGIVVRLIYAGLPRILYHETALPDDFRYKAALPYKQKK